MGGLDRGTEGRPAKNQLTASKAEQVSQVRITAWELGDFKGAFALGQPVAQERFELGEVQCLTRAGRLRLIDEGRIHPSADSSFMP
jgi:hypothetical protein